MALRDPLLSHVPAERPCLVLPFREHIAMSSHFPLLVASTFVIARLYSRNSFVLGTSLASVPAAAHGFRFVGLD